MARLRRSPSTLPEDHNMLSRHACLQLFALILAACAAPVQLRPTEPQSLAYGEDTASHPHPLDRPAVVLPRRVLPAQNFAHLSIGPKRTNRNDTRTPKQISQDACGGDGHFCKGTAIQHLVGAALGASCTACSVPEFDVDVLDATGCASDSNNGTTFTCGATGSGIGPLLSNEEHVRRLGGSSMPDVTYTGGISQVVKEKSSNVGLDKPIVWTPCAGPDVGYSIEGVLTQVGSCTLAAATNKVTTYSAPTLLTAT